jgi:hypothetical protein
MILHDDDDYVDGVRLRFWTAASKGPTIHPLGDIWLPARTAMVEWYWQGKTKQLKENLFQCHFVHQKSHMN